MTKQELEALKLRIKEKAAIPYRSHADVGHESH